MAHNQKNIKLKDNATILKKDNLFGVSMATVAMVTHSSSFHLRDRHNLVVRHTANFR